LLRLLHSKLSGLREKEALFEAIHSYFDFVQGRNPCQSFGIDGKQISYSGREKRSPKGRETILFVHGAGGGQYTWSFQKGFFEKEFNPIIMELPGHGESEGKGEQEIGRYAEHVYAFLKGPGSRKGFSGVVIRWVEQLSRHCL